jgi:hypothetical protein
MSRPILLAVSSVLLLACSGNAVVEPAEITSVRAKHFLDKCEPEPAPEGTGELEEVYACLPAEDVCPQPGDPTVKTALGYQLEKENECGLTVAVFDVPCGPDLNAVLCCYAVRIEKDDPCN